MSKGRVRTPYEKFLIKLSKEQQIAQKKEIPFAWAVAKAEIEDIKNKIQTKWERQGFVDKDFKMPDINWNKYSDLKNFEVLDEGHTADKQASKIHHMPIFVKWKKYKFKGFSNTYKVMESEESAVDRARQKHLTLQQQNVATVVGAMNKVEK